MFRHLTDILVAWGPAGILFLAVLDSSGVPVAGLFDVALIALAVERPSVAWLCAALAVAGSTVGSILLFLAARKSGSGAMSKATPDGRAAKFRAWFLRYGLVTVFIPALIPIPMPLKLFVISAGVTGTAFAEFVAVVLLARALRYFGEAWLGITLGQQSTVFLKVHAAHFVEGAIVLSLILYALIRWRDHVRQALPPALTNQSHAPEKH